MAERGGLDDDALVYNPSPPGGSQLDQLAELPVGLGQQGLGVPGSAERSGAFGIQHTTFPGSRSYDQLCDLVSLPPPPPPPLGF